MVLRPDDDEEGVETELRLPPEGVALEREVLLLVLLLERLVLALEREVLLLERLVVALEREVLLLERDALPERLVLLELLIVPPTALEVEALLLRLALEDELLRLALLL